MAGYITRRFTCLQAVTHPISNRAHCQSTAFSHGTACNDSCRLLLHKAKWHGHDFKFISHEFHNHNDHKVYSLNTKFISQSTSPRRFCTQLNFFTGQQWSSRWLVIKPRRFTCLVTAHMSTEQSPIQVVTRPSVD